MDGIKEARAEIQSQVDTVISSQSVDLIAYKRWFIQVANSCSGGGFIIDSQNKELVNSLFLYFLGLPGTLDIRKGLWIAGPIGTGKSTLMYIFSKFMQSFKMGFRVYVCSQITSEFSLNGDLNRYLANNDGYTPGPVPACFDELGREPMPTKYFGSELNVMQHILHIRYSYWQLYGLKTYVTTNLLPGNVESKYGDYIRDRSKEMFNIIVLDGTSRRQ